MSDGNIRTMEPTSMKGDENNLSFGHSDNKEEAFTLPFVGFNERAPIDHSLSF